MTDVGSCEVQENTAPTQYSDSRHTVPLPLCKHPLDGALKSPSGYVRKG